jgi:hypothetical protein
MVQESLDQLEWVLAAIQEWDSLVVTVVIRAMAVSRASQVTQVMAMEASRALVDSLAMQEWAWAMEASQREWAAAAVVAAVAVVNLLYMKVIKKSWKAINLPSNFYAVDHFLARR